MNQFALTCTLAVSVSLVAHAGEREDICTATKAILEKLVKDPKSLHEADAHDFSSITTYWGTVKLPGADACEYVERKDGAPPYYRCGMVTKPCDTMDQRYEALADVLSACLKPIERQTKVGEDDTKSSKWVVKSPLRVRLQFKPAKGKASCNFSYWVENY
jgi:hypothetical protein